MLLWCSLPAELGISSLMIMLLRSKSKQWWTSCEHLVPKTPRQLTRIKRTITKTLVDVKGGEREREREFPAG